MNNVDLLINIELKSIITINGGRLCADEVRCPSSDRPDMGWGVSDRDIAA